MGLGHWSLVASISITTATVLIIGIFVFYWRWWASTHWRLLIEDLEVVFLWAHVLSMKRLVCVRPESRQRAAS